MHISATYFGPGNGLIVFGDGDKSYAALVFGRDAAEEALRDKIIPEEKGQPFEFERFLQELPPVAAHPTVFLDTSCVVTMKHLIQVATDHWDLMCDNVRIPSGTVCSFFAAATGTADDAMIGFRHGRTGEHHFVIYFSKQQGEKILRGLSWLPKSEQRKNDQWLAESVLPQTSDRPMIDIEAPLANVLNGASILKRYLRAAN